MPPLKELHYFDLFGRTQTSTPRPRDEWDRRFLERLKRLSERAYLDLDGYAGLFETKRALLSGDITPAYSGLSEEVIEQIVARFPDAKVIFFARDPVERAWSWLSMAARDKTVPAFDPEDAEAVARNLLHPGALIRSFPSKIVARWRRYVRPGLFRVFFFDDLQQNPREMRRAVLEFLGADPSKPSGRLSPEDNPAGEVKKLPLTDEVRARLVQFFRVELDACACELGGAAKTWPARYGVCLLWLFAQFIDSLDLFVGCAA